MRVLLFSHTTYTAYRARSSGASPGIRSKLFMAWTVWKNKCEWMWRGSDRSSEFRAHALCDRGQPCLPFTRSELWLRKLHCGASGPAACRREKGQQAFSQRLAQIGPAALISAWLAGIPWKSASHYTFLDQELKLGFFVLSCSTSIGLFCVYLSL